MDLYLGNFITFHFAGLLYCKSDLKLVALHAGFVSSFNLRKKTGVRWVSIILRSIRFSKSNTTNNAVV